MIGRVPSESFHLRLSFVFPHLGWLKANPIERDDYVDHRLKPPATKPRLSTMRWSVG